MESTTQRSARERWFVFGLVAGLFALVPLACARSAARVEAQPPALTPTESWQVLASTLGDAYSSERVDVDLERATALLKSAGWPRERAGEWHYFAARVSAVAGDYAAAIRFANAPPALSAEKAAELQLLLPLWSGLQFAQGEASMSLVDADIAPRAAGAKIALVHPRAASPGLEQLDARVAALEARALRIPVLLTNDQGTLDVGAIVDGALSDLRYAFCSKDEDCPDAAVLTGTLQLANGKNELARASAERAALAFEAGKSPAQAGAAWLLAGDALSSKFSSPFDLDFRTLSAAGQQQQRAGLSREEFRRVPSADVQAARERYARAAAAFSSTHHSRGQAEVSARIGYLAFCVGDLAGAQAEFTRASHALLSAGATRDAYRAAVAANIVARLAHASAAEVAELRKLLDTATVDYGLQVGAIRLTARAAEFAEDARSDLRSALALSELSLDLARRANASQLLGDELLATAGVYSRFGLNRSAFPLIKEADALRSAPAETDAVGQLRRFEVVLSLVNGCLKAKDVDCAKRANGLVHEVELRLAKLKTPLSGDWLNLSRRNAGFIALQAGNPQRALELAHEAKDPDVEAIALLRLRKLPALEALLRARLSDALHTWQAAPAPPDPRGLLMLQDSKNRCENLVALALKANLPALAKQLLDEAETTMGTPVLSAIDREFLLARVQEAGKQASEALAHYRAGMSGLAQTAAQAETVDAESGFNDTTWAQQLDFVSFLLRNQHIDEGLVEFERFRSHKFRSALLNNLKAGNAVSAESLRAVRAQATVSQLEYQIANSASAVDAQLQHELESAKLARDQARAALSAKLGVRNEDPVQLSQVPEQVRRKIANSNVTVLVYLPLGTRSVAVVLAPGQPALARALNIADFALAPAVDRLQAKLEAVDEDWRTPARELYRMLLEPVAKLLPRPKAGARATLGIVAFGDVQRVPFQLLLRDTKPLVTDYDFFYSPSLLLQSLERGQAVASGQVHALGFNGTRLARAEDEARAIDSSAKVGAAATREALLSSLAAPGALFVGAHASFNKANPFLSYIELANGNLSLMDLQGLHLSCDLAVLSACETAKSTPSDSGDSVDFATTLLANGVSRVVVTSWQIDDALTLPLIKDFYGGIASGKSAADALASAQRHAQEEAGARAHPAFWAGFSLVSGGP